MIKEREHVLARLSIIMQVLLSFGCFFMAWWAAGFIKSIGGELTEYKAIFLFIGPVWYLLLDQFSLGNMARVKMYSVLFMEYIAVVGFGMIMLFASVVILDFDNLSRLVLVLFSGLNLVILFLYKILGFRVMKYFRGRGYNTKSILIIADKDSYYFIDRLLSTKTWGYRVWAIMSDSTFIKEKYREEYTVLDEQEHISAVIDGNTIDEVMYCKSDLNQDEIRSLIYVCAEVGVIFRMQSEFLSVVSVRSKLTYLNQLPFLTFMNTPRNYMALKLKVILGYLISSFILIVISPVMLVIALLVKMGDGGPVFFKQPRVGLHGRRFLCYKFRTMVTNAEALKASLMNQNEQEGPVFKIKEDPRVTRVGRFLRKTSLDELPQFINVLRGEMSIVGPRPPVPSEVKEYERWQRRRLSMKPGITCIWQVSGRNNIPFDQWMKMDMQYIDTWSLKLDFILFLKTFKVMITGDGQ
jgi:exopolysaccharide biosynthesis polyprenyl glycosylphosphotransferase